MKKRFFILLSAITALSLTGCRFFDLITGSSETSYTPWEGGKQTLSYSQKDLTENSLYSKYDTMPISGKPKLLIIPIEFNDTNLFLDESQKAEVITKLNKAAFGTNEDTGWYSISSFYKTESFGKCEIEGEVAPWYSSGYSFRNVSENDTENIVKAAVNNWKSNNPSKVNEFDSDNNGYLDGVIAIYGCPDYKTYNKDHTPGISSNMWAYTSWLSTDASITSPNANVFIWASYDFMDQDNQGGMTIDAHTYIHEMGHVFGLDDYYDYANNGEVWAGGYSMQDYNIGGHDPYSLLTFGWVEPYVPTNSTTINIRPFESSGDVILLSPDFSSNSPFDEYILIEYYSPTGVNAHDSEYQYCDQYPLGPNRGGIRIWHVDSRLSQKVSASTYNTVTTIDRGNGIYTVGCTNSPTTDKHWAVDSKMRKYHLLDIIRRGDYTASKTSEYISVNTLFKEGDTFTLKKYSGYFKNINKLDKGSYFNWSVTVDNISSTQARISVSI